MMQEIERIADQQELMVEALKAAHHKLTTLHGLWATDEEVYRGPNHFRVYALKVLEQIEEALNG